MLGVSCGAETCPACWQSDCHTTCCSDSDCAEGCQVANEVETPLGTITTTVCDARGTGGFSVGLYGESECGQIGSPFFTYCASGFQWVTEMTMGIATACVCSAPCCSHADCTDGGADPDARCVSTSTGHTQCYSALIFEPLMGGALGDHCSDWDDCASGACHPDGYCTEPCCSEMNCPTGSRCVPTLGSGGSYANLCTIP